MKLKVFVPQDFVQTFELNLVAVEERQVLRKEKRQEEVLVVARIAAVMKHPYKFNTRLW